MREAQIVVNNLLNDEPTLQANRVNGSRKSKRIGMTEEAKNESVTEQETATPVEATESQPNESEVSNDKPVEGSKDYNWRKMEDKIQALERNNQELSQAVKQSKPEPVAPAPEEGLPLDREDLPNVAQAERIAQNTVKKELAAIELAEMPKRAREAHKDYYQVVNNENIEQLIKEDPELEHDIKVAKNPYTRAYKAIKQAQFYRDKMKNADNKERIEANTNKPVSSNTVGKQSPLDQANAFATWSKEDLYKEMMSSARKAH